MQKFSIFHFIATIVAILNRRRAGCRARCADAPVMSVRTAPNETAYDRLNEQRRFPEEGDRT
jgi:hypothetical protein